MPTKQTKPIAVIALSTTGAIDWLREKMNIREINFAKRRLLSNDGQVYIIVTKLDHVRGMEWSTYMVAPNAVDNTDFERIMEDVREHIRS